MEQISLRNAEPADWPAIEALHKEQQAKQGTNYELPKLFGGKMIAIVLVGCDDTGKIHNCIYVEAVAEMRTIGCSTHATMIGQQAADGLCFVLQQMGFRFLECYVPRSLGKASKTISKLLLGARFKSKVKEFRYFSRDLRGQ